MIDRNDEPQYPTDAISLLKADHRKIKNLFARSDIEQVQNQKKSFTFR